MKKISKALLITSMAVVTIGSIKIFSNNVVEKMADTNKTTIQAYNHDAPNILDNVFEQNGMTILPFIFENTNKNITKEKVISDFNSKGLTVTSIVSKNSNGQTVTVKNNEGKEIVATGTEIKVSQSNTVYTVLVYGDVNRSGIVDLIDAQKIMLHVQNATKYPLNTIEFLAANISNDDNTINLIDAQRLVMLKLGATTKLVKNEPISLKESDTTPPVISINGQVVTGTQTITIKVGDTYTEPTVTATDNVDGNVTVTKTGDTVDSDREGTYTVVYTASDAKGNKATVTRIVVVEPKGGEVTPPSLTDVIIGEGDTSIEKVNLHVVQPSDMTNIETEGKMIYTTVPITFKDQNGNNMSVTESEINNKLTITLPKMKILGQNISTNNIVATKYYDKDGDGKVDRIGFAITNTDVNLEGIDDITFQIGSKSISLPVEIKYNDTTTLALEEVSKTNDEGIQNAGKIGNIYTIRKGQDFVLGTIKAQQGERPVTENDVNATIGGGTGLSISYDYDKYGNLLIKGNLKDAGNIYGVTLTVTIRNSTGDVTRDLDMVQIKAIELPDNLNMAFKNYYTNDQMSEQEAISLKVNETTRAQLIVKEGENIVNNMVSSEYTTITATVREDNEDKIVDYMQFVKCKPDDDPDAEEGDFVNVADDEVVPYIQVKANRNAVVGKTVKVTVIFYEGLPTLETKASFNVNIIQ